MAAHGSTGAVQQPYAAGGGQTAAASADAELLAEQETRQDHLASRAAAVSSSLDSLRQAQSAQGVGLRGDIVAAEHRMQTFMSKADAAMQKQDAQAAQKYLDSAETEVRILEEFLGR
jgi:hypothetical protein